MIIFSSRCNFNHFFRHSLRRAHFLYATWLFFFLLFLLEVRVVQQYNPLIVNILHNRNQYQQCNTATLLPDGCIDDKVNVWVLLLDPVVPFGFVLPLVDAVARPRCRVEDLLSVLKAFCYRCKRCKTLTVEV